MPDSPPTQPNRIESILLVAACVVLAVTVALTFVSQDVSFRIVAELVKLFLTVYASYAITRAYSQRAMRLELHDVAKVTMRRLVLLATDIQGIASELTASADERTLQSTAVSLGAQLRRMATHAEASIDDIGVMARLDISLATLKEEIRTRIVDSEEEEIAPCPSCSKPVSVNLLTSPSSKQVACRSCSTMVVFHRLPDGGVKIRKAGAIVKCPNPSCAASFQLREKPTDFGIVIRNCYECFARIKYDLDTSSVQSFQVVTPYPASADAAPDGRITCPHCAAHIPYRPFTNAAGRMVQGCMNCRELLAFPEPSPVPGA
jgi:hypothetical protein